MTSPGDTAIRVFEDEFGYRPSHLVVAPGRVNLIGEHTDYNDGFVLPCAIDFHTAIACANREDGRFRAVAADYSAENDEFDVTAPIEFREDRMWANYVRGTVAGLLESGCSVAGADLSISGNIPQGAGLSSSAALEVAVGQAMKELNALDIDGASIAKNGQRAENDFVGCSCGIMDQLISVMGREDHALLIDCRSLETRLVPLPPDAAIVIINSNKRRGLVDSEYNIRRQQCEQAAKHFGVAALRDVSPERFERGREGLDDTVAKRAYHVITENDRTLRAAEALAVADLRRVGELMVASHASMRDDFEITVPEVDVLADIINDVVGGEGGARMTGGGFGGCVVGLVPRDAVTPIKDAVAEAYERRTGLRESVYVCGATAGARLEKRLSFDGPSSDSDHAQ